MNKIAIFVNPGGQNAFLESFLTLLSQSPSQTISSPKICVLGHAEQLPSYAIFPSPERKTRYESLMKQAAEKTVGEVLALVSKLGLSSEAPEILSGRFPSCVSQWTDSNDVDLLVKQALPFEGQLGQVSKGDVKLSRSSSAPVLLLQKELRKGSATLVGIEPLPEDQSRDRFCLELVSRAASWARLLSGPLVIVHAWQLWGEGLVRNWVPSEEVEEGRELQRKSAEAAVQRVLAKANLKDLHPKLILEKGLPTAVLSEAIKTSQAELVILGSAANEGIKKAILGNTAEDILRSEGASLLIVR